jgi:hypothetical protein
MKTDYSALPAPAIQGGSSDVARSIARFMPSGTDVMVEGLQRFTARDRDPTLVLALGRIEGSRLDRELPSLEATIESAQEDARDVLRDGLTFSYTLVNPSSEPLSDYQIGDVLMVHDPPEVDFDCRFVDIEVAVSPQKTEWQVEFTPTNVSGS